MNAIMIFFVKGSWSPEMSAMLKGKESPEAGRYQLELGSSWLAVTSCLDAFREYEDWEEKTIRAMISQPEAFLVEWRGDDILQKFMDELPKSIGAIVDNDYGLVCPVEALSGKLVAEWVRREG